MGGLLLVPLQACDSVLADELRTGRPKSVGMSAERLFRIDEAVREAIEQRQTPGAVVLVARRATIVYRKAFGVRALVPQREPMEVDTIFDVASLTKVVATATSIMILVEEGRISLTDPVVHYLPGFGVHGKEKITLLQLLTHFSGLRPDVDLDQPWQGYDTAISLGLTEKPVAAPGEQFIYSDINYFLLGEIVRKVSGQSLDQFARERIFQPLEMKDTGFNPPVQWRHRIAPTEVVGGEMLRGVVHDPTARRMGGVAGHAGLFSTSDDLAIYAQMILNGGVYNDERILAPLSVMTMTTPQSPPQQQDWRGIGFDIRTRWSTTRGDLFPLGSFGHTGFTGTSLWIDPWTETFVILFTSRLHPDGKGDVVPLRKRVASIVAASILDTPVLRQFFSR